MYTLLHLGALTATVLLLARFLPGIRLRSWQTAALVAVVFSLLNWVVGWLVKVVVVTVLAIPAVFTLGLALLLVPFAVNTVVLWLTDKVLHAFEIKDGKTLLLGASGITLANWFVQFLFHH